MFLTQDNIFESHLSIKSYLWKSLCGISFFNFFRIIQWALSLYATSPQSYKLQGDYLGLPSGKHSVTLIFISITLFHIFVRFLSPPVRMHGWLI